MKAENVMDRSTDKREPLVISLEDAAWRLSVSPSFLRLEISRGGIRPVRFGRRVMISAAEIERYVAANTRGASGEADAEASTKKPRL